MRLKTWILGWALLSSVGASAAELSLRLEPGAGLPLSQPQASYFNPGGGGLLGLQIGLLSFLDVQLQVGALVLPDKEGAPVVGAGSAIFAGAGARLLRPKSGSLIVPWLDVGAHYVNTGSLSRMALGVGAGALFRWSETTPFWFGPHVRYLHVLKLVDESGYFSADAALLTIGLTLELDLTSGTSGPIDTDGDGLLDDVDKCPDVPAHTPDGCPDKDTDGDQVVDRLDKCPTVVGLARFDGCPDPDPDHDGLIGVNDKCPNEPEDFDGYQDEDGCPDPDNDGDGVPDEKDACPTEKGPDTTRGCPDADSDGVADKLDACVNVPGPKENGGCPVYKQVVVTEQKVEIKQKIFFAFGRADILPKSFELMNEVTQALSDHDRLCVRIEGHTDAKGSRPANLKLSDDRAKSVMKYLLDKGIAARRLGAIGYGPDQPLDDNATAEGREKNRRVEFVIVPCKTEGAP